MPARICVGIILGPDYHRPLRPGSCVVRLGSSVACPKSDWGVGTESRHKSKPCGGSSPAGCDGPGFPRGNARFCPEGNHMPKGRAEMNGEVNHTEKQRYPPFPAPVRNEYPRYPHGFATTPGAAELKVISQERRNFRAGSIHCTPVLLQDPRYRHNRQTALFAAIHNSGCRC